MKKVIHTLTLFSSFSTLFCCALPALFVALGAGATLAGLVTNFPQLVFISEHKIALFIFAGCMLTLSGTMRWRNRNAPCPIEPDKAKACGRLKKISGIVFFFSLTVYLIGVFFAFIAPKIF